MATSRGTFEFLVLNVYDGRIRINFFFFISFHPAAQFCHFLNPQSKGRWSAHYWNVCCLFPSGLELSASCVGIVRFISLHTPREQDRSPCNTAACTLPTPTIPLTDSRHGLLKHTTWSSLFNYLISLHSTTDRLFVFIFFPWTSHLINYQTLFFLQSMEITRFLPIWKRKLQDAVSFSEVPKRSLLPQSFQSHGNLAISLFIPPSRFPVKFLLEYHKSFEIWFGSPFL